MRTSPRAVGALVVAACMAFVLAACGSSGSSGDTTTTPSGSTATIASSLVLGGAPTCPTRPFCQIGLEKTYGLKFKSYLPVDLAKRHSVLTDGQADVSVVFTTDGQIKADNLALLEDDLKFLPPYNVTLLTRDQTIAAAGPDMAQTIEKVQTGLTTPVMQELNSRVDLDKQTPAAVATQYLKESGYVK